MAIKPDYSAGLATLAAGSTTVTFSGGANITAADIQPGDTFKVQNLDAIIATVTDATHIELTAPWTGTTLAAAPYRIRYQPDGSRFTAALRDLVSGLTNGVLQGINALGSAANKFVYYDVGGNPQLNDITADSRDLLGFFSKRPIVVLVTGQSNGTLEQSYTWTPPSNLKIWNYTKVAGNVGTAFVSPSGTVMSLALAYGRKLAIENPHRTIYIINIALGANSIGGWLPSVVLPDRDVYTDIVANVPPALVAAGVTQIDAYIWWQIEGDKGALAAYPAKFETMMARMRTNSWFKESTPTIIHGCSSNAISGDPTYGPCNKTLQAVVNADPQRRKFVYTASISTSLWTDTPKIHMTGAGYEQAGALGVDAYMGKTNGIQQQFVFDMDVPTGGPDIPPASFVPVIVGTTVAGAGTYTGQTGFLWRNGKRRDFVISLTWTAHTGTGAMQIAGLPDLPISTGFPVPIYMSNITFSGQVLARLVAAGPDALVQPLQVNSNAASTVLPIDAVGTILVSGTYYVA